MGKGFKCFIAALSVFLLLGQEAKAQAQRLYVGVYKTLKKISEETPDKNESSLPALNYYTREDTISHMRVVTHFHAESTDGTCTGQSVSIATRETDVVHGILVKNGFVLRGDHYLKAIKGGNIKAQYVKPLVAGWTEVKMTMTY
jgi:hypothetical protein